MTDKGTQQQRPESRMVTPPGIQATNPPPEVHHYVLNIFDLNINISTLYALEFRHPKAVHSNQKMTFCIRHPNPSCKHESIWQEIILIYPHLSETICLEHSAALILLHHSKPHLKPTFLKTVGNMSVFFSLFTLLIMLKIKQHFFSVSSQILIM